MTNPRISTYLALFYLLTFGWFSAPQQVIAVDGVPFLGVQNRAGGGGVLVTVVAPGTPAEKAGLMVKDVLLSADGIPLRTSVDLSSAVRAKRPGEVMELELKRADKTIKVKVVIGTNDNGTRPVTGQPSSSKTVPDRNDGRIPLLGIAANPDSRLFAITEIVPGSAAQKVGLRVGDIVRRLDGERLGKVEDLTELLGKKKQGDEVDLEIIRNGESITLRVALGS